MLFNIKSSLTCTPRSIEEQTLQTNNRRIDFKDLEIVGINVQPLHPYT